MYAYKAAGENGDLGLGWMTLQVYHFVWAGVSVYVLWDVACIIIGIICCILYFILFSYTYFVHLHV